MGKHKHMNAFLKDNIAIVAAIALPLILALLFGLSTLMTRVTVTDPKYDFLITDDYYESNSSFLINVVNEKLVVSYRAPQKDANGSYLYNNTPRLWRVHVPEMQVEQIALPEPANKSAVNLKIPGITDVKVVNLQPGPDGYTYSNSYSYGNNLMTEIFNADRGDHYRSAIFKEGRAVPFRIGDGRSYYNMQFVGWIVEDKK